MKTVLLNTADSLPTNRETLWFWSESSKAPHLQGIDSYVGWHLGSFDGKAWSSMIDPTWSELDGPVRFWMPTGVPNWSHVQALLGARPHV